MKPLRERFKIEAHWVITRTTSLPGVETQRLFVFASTQNVRDLFNHRGKKAQRQALRDLVSRARMIDAVVAVAPPAIRKA